VVFVSSRKLSTSKVVAFFALLVLGLSSLWAFYQIYLACFSTRYALSEQETVSDQAQEGVAFTERGAGQLAVYSNRFQCLQVERRKLGDTGDWVPDEDGLPRRIWLKFGANLEVVEREDCNALSADLLPSAWALSAGGTRLAWVWGEARHREGQALYVARVDEGVLADLGRVRAVTKGELPLPLSVRAIQFVGEDRLLLQYPLDRAYLWDCLDEAPVQEYRLAKGATAISARGEIVASADLGRGELCLTVPDRSLPACRTVLRLIEPGELAPTGRRGTALALGRQGFAVLASSAGTYAVLREREGKPEIVVGERTIPGLKSGVTAAAWLDDRTMAFGGSSGALHVVHLDNDPETGNVTARQAYPITLQSGAEKLEWMEVDADHQLIVYGTPGGVFSARLDPVCERSDSRSVLGIFFGVCGVVSVLLAIVMMAGWARQGGATNDGHD
jgi:hypothetical protein